MQQFDCCTIEQMGMSSLVLMERAALGVVEEIRKRYSLKHVLVVCGSGNNGADGMAIARILWLQGYQVSVFLVGSPKHFSREAQIQWKILENYHVPIVNKCCYNEYTTIVDAIFGIGLSRTISGYPEECIQEINKAEVPIVAVDIPSGVHATTGQILGCAIRADVTITFAYEKIGLRLYPGASCAGNVITKDVGIYAVQDPAFLAVDEEEWKWIPRRPADGNKGTFGKVLLLAGSRDICGAAYLSAKACLLSGAGMVKLFTEENNRIPLQQLLPEALIASYNEASLNQMLVSLEEAWNWADVVLAGPGIGTGKAGEQMISWILNRKEKKPIVLDADALNILSQNRTDFFHCGQSFVLTPHLGEISRLSGYPISQWKQDPISCLERFWNAFDVPQTIVMKDARTLTLTQEKTWYINLTGNSGMATAGSGDVLAGCITGWIAQGMDPAKAAPFGVWLHGLAGDYMQGKKGSYSMLASDLLEAMPYLLKGRE